MTNCFLKSFRTSSSLDQPYCHKRLIYSTFTFHIYPSRTSPNSYLSSPTAWQHLIEIALTIWVCSRLKSSMPFQCGVSGLEMTFIWRERVTFHLCMHSENISHSPRPFGRLDFLFLFLACKEIKRFDPLSSHRWRLLSLRQYTALFRSFTIFCNFKLID